MSLRNGRSKQACFQGENRRSGIAGRLCRLAGSPSSLQRPFHVVEVIAAHAQKVAVRVLRSDGRPPPRKTRFPAAGPALSDGIGYPKGFTFLR